MLHPTVGTNYLPSFVSLIFQMSHFLRRLMSFHLSHLHLFYYPLLHHSFTQNSKLICFINLSAFVYLCTHRTDSPSPRAAINKDRVMVRVRIGDSGPGDSEPQPCGAD